MIVGLHGDALKIKLKAPPVDGAANKMCIDFLAKFFQLPKSSLEITAGHTSRTKQVLIRFPEGTPAEPEQQRIKGLIDAFISP